MEKRERLSEQLILRVTPTEREEIKKYADSENLNLSNFIRNALITYIDYLKNREDNESVE